MLIKTLAHILKKEKPAVNENCTQFEVNNWEISRFVLKKLVAKVGLQPFPLDELMLLSSAVVRLRPEYIFEWGTHVGKSARVFYEVTKYYTIPCQIHSIDLPDEASHVEHPRDKRGMLVKNLRGVILHQGDGLEVSAKVLSSLSPTPKNILFFLDGDHSYSSVKRELDFISTRFPQAAILAHDTFYQSQEAGYNVGPWQAVEELLRSPENQYTKIEINTGLPGMTLLYKK